MSNLDTFAKVRALHDRTANPGEKAAAAGRMEALARRLGMTVAEALSKLDRQAERPKGPSFDDIFNNPAHQRARAERERERAEKWRAVVAEYGSEEAVFRPGPWERALRSAGDRFRCRGTTTGWRIGSLWGWDILSVGDPPPEIAEAIAAAYPMPTTVRETWAELRFWDKLMRDREARGVGRGDPSPEVHFRTVLMERALDTLPAGTLNDLRARLDWLDHLNRLEIAPDPAHERVRLATLRADVERMGARLREQDAAGVQNGQQQGGSDPLPPSPGPSSDPVQSGHVRRTNAAKRADVLELLGSAEDLTDREIARRAGVSPSTVGSIRRAQVARPVSP